MSAVTEIEKLIKEAQKESERLEGEKNKALEDEVAEKKREESRLEEEEKQKIIEQEREMEERRSREEELRNSGLKKALEGSQDVLVKAKAKLQEELEEQLLQAKEDERKKCHEEMETQIFQAAENLDSGITKAKKDLEKAKSAAQRFEAKVASAETEYKSLLETEEEDATREQGELEKGKPSKNFDIICSLTLENKRRAAEAQQMSSSMVCDLDLSAEFDYSDNPLNEHTDPKYGRSIDDWSVLAKKVTGIADALYSEPSESPYYEHNERIHSLIGSSLKEYIRDNNRRLLDEWTQLAEEYEVRKRLYEKQQKKLARKGSSRGSISVSGRKSILGDKNPGERIGLERGNILESSGRASNNPYRRARRGNEVRSEYEQEQIIAEIAAKEAMEKRITHGGSKVPRQICRLERVS